MASNEAGQLVGDALGDWRPPPFPPAVALQGATVGLEPLEHEGHGPGLWRALQEAPLETWTYMTFGPFRGYDDFAATLRSIAEPDDWLLYAIIVDGEPQGFAAYLRINPGDGVIEIGSIVFSPALQRTTPATEAMYLMIRNIFDLGYRRCEWK
ncbi:MAG TPA: GNAT family protein, partial [Acidimicrobiia bacterium]